MRIPRPSSSSLPSARDRILNKAQALFYQNGVRGTGVDRIIAEASVTKVTFYRHFPSKDDLVLAYLEHRHAAWTAWFREALVAARADQSEDERQNAPLAPLLDAARAWFATADFRGCAFANTVAEAGQSVPGITGIATRHKQEVRDAIAALLPATDARAETAWAATLALDGAAVNAQLSPPAAEAALAGLRVILDALERERAVIPSRR
ncbi:TetR/AcrR family transcriptional regulator [Methylobacterium sp. W2]|uniref:TetR/AcrR family transcriptional regulator n=1 Tax=Methylobacterium sp. W2 TaxID=2598107 RepID=UPI001D0C7DCE|nr:TetR/AcrR family transcriptional regulator [Methylobacterium sp. W2]MCC0808411.1 TetR/AcrR family transcriptional regulator [Methylobacterium sp. W2]